MQLLKAEKPVEKADSRLETTVVQLSDMVREKTLSSLAKAKIIQKEESTAFESYLIDNKVSSGEILSLMADLRGVKKEEQSETVLTWGRALAPIVKKRYSFVQFAGKVAANSSFFQKHENVLEVASALKCPLIYAEDSDVAGFGTINPVAGAVIADYVLKSVTTKSGASPFISMFLVELNSWKALCSKQFKDD